MLHDPQPSFPPRQCARCAKELVPGRVIFFNIVIEAIADPTPVIDSSLSEQDVSGLLEQLLQELIAAPVSDAMNQVYRRLQLCLCGPCYRSWIEEPTR